MSQTTAYLLSISVMASCRRSLPCLVSCWTSQALQKTVLTDIGSVLGLNRRKAHSFTIMMFFPATVHAPNRSDALPIERSCVLLDLIKRLVRTLAVIVLGGFTTS